MSNIYDQNHRDLQDEFQSRELADRLDELIVHPALDEAAQAFINCQNHVFLSSVDAEGFPTTSHKGGDTGFIKIVDDKTLLVPCFDGNGMWLSAGNIGGQAKVGLLFIDFENPHRLRVQGEARLVRDASVLSAWPEVALAMEINITKVWINCPRYIRKMQAVGTAEHVPREGVATPEADWKSIDIIADVVPPKPHQVNKA